VTKADGVSSQSRYWVPLAERTRILTAYRRVAVVGLSANPFRPSHFVAIYLISKGFDVVPVNPREKEILGRKCYASLKDIPGPVEIVDVFRDPAAVPAIVEEAIEIGAKVLWLQLGVIHEAAAERAVAAGMAVVMDRCIKIEHGRLFGGLQTIGLNTGIISSRKIII
jgi:predicted CoA-binding protein